MNETSATSASGDSLLPDGITTLTTIHFAIIAVLALFVIAGLLWGIKAKRSRKRRRATSSPTPAKPASNPHPSRPPICPPRRRPPPLPKRPRRQPRSRPRNRLPRPASRRSRPPRPRPPPRFRSHARSRPHRSQSRPRPLPRRPPRRCPTNRSPPPALDANPAAEAATPTEAPAPTPTPTPAPAPTPAVDHAAAPVTQLKGLGPKVATRLAELGVTTVGDMAALSETEAQNIDAQLGAFTGRMGRDRWIEQSRLLAAGDKPGF
ncbi:hypothetical protein QP185_10070 [Sphingomonas aerolata]|uniref:hypothetical protein n=1 Tax=Sphingomonas aerolata TaxID=185951 RepID=UPI002FE32445